MTLYKIAAINPLIFRDGRPFNAAEGRRMNSINWPTPSVMAGALRSFYAKSFDVYDPSKLTQIAVRGPFPFFKEQLYFPVPLDSFTIQKNDKFKTFKLRPNKLKNDEGVFDFDFEPLFLNSCVREKPSKNGDFWSRRKMLQWLLDDEIDGDNLFSSESDSLSYPQKESRTHVSIDEKSRLSKQTENGEGLLFHTEGLDFRSYERNNGLNELNKVNQIYMILDADLPNKQEPSGLFTVGGERRLAIWEIFANQKYMSIDMELETIFSKKQNFIRMILATPAIFNCGWIPDWLTNENGKFIGIIPNTNLKTRLVSAAVGKWQPVSGWDLETQKPKSLRRMVPAGSVYFFEILSGDLNTLKNCWLKSICEQKEDQNNGFGLALWGIWKRSDINE